MAIPPEPADDEQRPSGDLPPDSMPPSVPGGSSLPSDSSALSQPEGTNPDEGLPEWEPLTPELVEDEAIRGDFVIRWAVVGLALLFGVAAVTDTRTLVHIRSGEYMAAHGVLPPSKDVFSYTANDRPWINLSWMFDLVAAGIHAVSGGIGLSILQGVLAGLAFGLLVHTHRSGIRTWWGSICAVLALLVCYPQFTAQPELISLLGLSLVLWLVQRADETANSRLLWSCVGVIWLWSQLDTRAFLGWLLLICLAAGESLRKSDQAAQRRALWWKVALASFAVTIIHPFLWQSWLSPIRLFAIDYPALQHSFTRPGTIELGFYPITQSAFWLSINHDTIAALVLFAATLVSLFLNRERVHPGQVIAVVVFNALACLATHEFAAASLVNCVVCTINAQSWYRQRFGQIYSIDWRELLFSRGGRAVTVVSFFALAWLVISGRIEGPEGRRTGLGFGQNLQTQMDSYQEAAKDNLDDRPFHFTARQGDLVVWSKQKSFIDTRAAIFTGSGDHDLIALHDRTRRSMQKGRKSLPGSGEPGVWRATFEKYQVTHTMPRLSGPTPPADYVTFGDLLASGDWAMTKLTASTAVYYRDSPGPPQSDHVAEHRLDFDKQAFRSKELSVDTVRMCGKPASFTDGIFSVRRSGYPAGVQVATHYLQLASANGSVSPQFRIACALLAIRNANLGLREDSNSAEGYRCLGMAYLILDEVETGLMNAAGVRWFNSVRYYETVGALQQATLLRPNDLLTHYELLGLFERTQRGELALEAIRQIKRIRPVTMDSSEEERKQREQLLNIESTLEDALAKYEGQVEEGLQKADRFQIAASAYQVGAIRLAVRTLEDDPIYKAQNPLARNALGSWLIEVGRVQEGIDTLDQATVGGGAPGWRDAVATSLLINGDYNRAIDLWREQLAESNATHTQTALLTMPFVTLNAMWMSPDQYPFTHLAAAGEIVSSGRGEDASLTYQIGQAQLELGDIAGATQSFSHILDRTPTTHLRPLIKFYLEALTDKKIELPSIEPPKQEEFELLDQETPEKKAE
ncbi:MAG: hypothetical protein JWP89_918 [Schlesneria sp.]|nr:hypothetical protein [Schlesneria sp.]